jgi:glycerophosphoryl diester phosphodiesterase
MGGRPGRPLVVAHRGSSHAVAEHTLGSYMRALDEGADGLECDVRLTRDGHLVCVHDRRVDRTSSGRGLVSEFDLDDLRALDFGSWHTELPGSADDLVERRPFIEERDTTEAPVLTLERLLATVGAAGRPVRLLIETKHPTRYAGLVEQQLVRLLDRFGLATPADPAASPVSVMSFAPVALRRVRLLAPLLPTVQLYDRVPVLRRDGSLSRAADVAGPGVHILRTHPGYVRRVHARGHRVYVWTVDEPADIDLVLGLGVDAVITNRPTDVLARLAEGNQSG